MSQGSVEFVRSVYSLDEVPRPRKLEVAFFGRSNVGKSSWINVLAGRTVANVSRTPGKTRCLNYFVVDRRYYWVDVPGYGYSRVSRQMKNAWTALVDTWLKDPVWLKLVLLIVDARVDPQPSDVHMAAWLDRVRVPFVVIANKTDRMLHAAALRQLALWDRALAADSRKAIVPASARTRKGRVEVLKWVQREVRPA